MMKTKMCNTFQLGRVVDVSCKYNIMGLLFASVLHKQSPDCHRVSELYIM